MQKLTQLLQACPEFTDADHENYVPVHKQVIYLKMAEVFQTKQSHLYEDPEELVESTNMGTAEIWEEFINLDPVQIYAAARTKRLASVAARNSIRNLQKSAKKGDVQAIKYLNEVSGVLNAQNQQGTIILHYVPRPKSKPPKQAPQKLAQEEKEDANI